MKNLILRLISLFGSLRAVSRAEAAGSTFSGRGQEPDPDPSPVWKKIGILLDTQSRVHALDEGERHSISAPIKPESLDMALRELRLAERFALNGMEPAETIPEDVLNEPGDPISPDPIEGTSSQANKGDDLHLSDHRNV